MKITIFFTTILSTIIAAAHISAGIENMKPKVKLIKRAELFDNEKKSQQESISHRNRKENYKRDRVSIKPGPLIITLEWFIQRLQSLVSAPNFDIEGFDWEIERLERHLSDINNAFDLFSPYIKESWGLSTQISYANSLFQNMKDFTELLKFYSINHRRAQGLIHRVTKANLQLMGLFDSHGVPDPRKKSYENTINRLIEDLEKSKEAFESLPRPPSSLKVAFKFVFNKAKRLLADLVDSD
ncbi:hypothetical protein JCM33374_g2084 [Metschnikowia sp. JCM 33374]|nr:hypothetical protein JCM33374_g2084 [Metschnikowia sp. JCM 33374]